MPPQFDLLEDGLQEHGDDRLLVQRPRQTRGTYSGQESAIWRVWLKEKGIKTVFIDPFYNYTNAAMDGTWLPPRPGSDTALAMAIAYVWITEGTYDKQYIAEKTVGFDEFKDYILGEVDDKVRQDAGMGREGIRHSGAQDPRPGPRVGSETHHASAAAAAAAKAAPAAPPTAPNGPA